MPLGSDFDMMEINQYLIQHNRDAYEKFKDVASVMKRKLNQHQWYVPVAFTPHDFDHHVIRVLQYGSHLLARSLGEFSTEELLAFQYACLFHDIDMVYNPSGRECHAANACIVLNPYIERGSSDESEMNNLLQAIESILQDTEKSDTINEELKKSLTDRIFMYLQNAFSFLIPEALMRDAMGQIVFGHSDIKNKKEEDTEFDIRVNTLNRTFYPGTYIGNQRIRTRVLAAILRLADELDCSIQRRAGIEEATIDEIIRLNRKSEKYWERLKLISYIDFQMPQINIIVNTRYIRATKDETKCFEMLKEVYDKVLKEYRTIQKVFEEDNFNIAIFSPRLVFDDNDMENRFHNYFINSKEGQ